MDRVIENALAGLTPKYNRFIEIEKLLLYPEIIADTKYYRSLSDERNGLIAANELFLLLSELRSERRELLAEAEGSDKLADRSFYTSEIALLDNKISDAVRHAEEYLQYELAGSHGCSIELIYRKEKASEGFLRKLKDMFELRAKAYGFSVKEEDGIILIVGSKAYSQFASENGIHKIIPYEKGTKAESSSLTFTALVIPTLNYSKTIIEDKDVRIDIYLSTGAGGQKINKVETAVRAIHLPTGIMVTCQDERSQRQNKLKALAELKERVEKNDKKEYEERIKKEREKAISKANSRKVRLYDFKLGTATDYTYNPPINRELNSVLKGERI